MFVIEMPFVFAQKMSEGVKISFQVFFGDPCVVGVGLFLGSVEVISCIKRNQSQICFY